MLRALCDWPTWTSLANEVLESGPCSRGGILAGSVSAGPLAHYFCDQDSDLGTLSRKTSGSCSACRCMYSSAPLRVGQWAMWARTTSRDDDGSPYHIPLGTEVPQMPDSTHDSEDLESYWAEVRRPDDPSRSSECSAVVSEWDAALDSLSDQMLTARSTVTLRRDVLLLAVQTGLNPADIPEEIWAQDGELQRCRHQARRIGYVPPSVTSTVLGRALLVVALRLQSRDDKPEAAFALEGLRWQR